MSQFFTSGGQSIRTSASASILPMNIDFLHDWLVWSLCSLRDSQESSPTPQLSINDSVLSLLYVQLSHPYMITDKTIALTRWIFVSKVVCLLFNMLSMLVIAFLPRSKHLLITRLQSPSAVIFGAQENKVCHCLHYLPFYFPWSDGNRCYDLHLLNAEF